MSLGNAFSMWMIVKLKDYCKYVLQAKLFYYAKFEYDWDLWMRFP